LPVGCFEHIAVTHMEHSIAL